VAQPRVAQRTNKDVGPSKGVKGFNGRIEKGHLKIDTGLLHREIKPVSFWGT
jgi:hypothetical protein